MSKQTIIFINLVSAPRSTEINTSHGHATTIKVDEIKGTMVPMVDKINGTMVPNTEVNLAEGQHERNTESAYSWRVNQSLIRKK